MKNPHYNRSQKKKKKKVKPNRKDFLFKQKPTKEAAIFILNFQFLKENDQNSLWFCVMRPFVEIKIKDILR